MEAHIRRAFVFARTAHRIVKRVRDQQVAASYQKPMREPTHFVVSEIMSIRAAELIRIPTAIPVYHDRSGGFRLGRFATFQG